MILTNTQNSNAPDSCPAMAQIAVGCSQGGSNRKRAYCCPANYPIAVMKDLDHDVEVFDSKAPHCCCYERPTVALGNQIQSPRRVLKSSD